MSTIQPVYILIITTVIQKTLGVRCSSMVELRLMVQWVIGPILRDGPNDIFLSYPASASRLWYVLSCLWDDSLSYFSFQPVLHDWCNKGCGKCYPVCGMVHIKEPLLLIGKRSACSGSSGFLSRYMNGLLRYVLSHRQDNTYTSHGALAGTRNSSMGHPIDRITHTTAFVTPVVEHWLEWIFHGHEAQKNSPVPVQSCSVYALLIFLHTSTWYSGLLIFFKTDGFPLN